MAGVGYQAHSTSLHGNHGAGGFAVVSGCSLSRPKVLACFRVVEGRVPQHEGHDLGANASAASGSGSVSPAAAAIQQSGKGIELLKGSAGVETFSLGANGLIYYLDPSGSSAKDGSYAIIQNFEKGDKIQLVCDEMGDYSLLACDTGETAGICTCIYYNSDDQAGGHVDLIACVTGPDALKLDLLDASAFIWDITPAAIDAKGGSANDILIGTDATDELIGNGGSDVIIGAMGADRLIGVDPQVLNPGRGEVDVLIGAPGADSFVLGGKGKVYYLDPLGQSSRSYAAIQDFEKGDQIVLACDEMGDYSLQSCTIGLSAATCIYYERDGVPGVGLTDELIATVQGPDALKLDLMDASTFVWDITPASIDATGGSTNDILIGGDAADELVGRGGSDVIIGAMGADRLVGVDPQALNPGRGEVDVLIGAPGADTFVLGGNSLIYYLDPQGQSSRSYAAIQDFEKGDKIVLLGSNSNYALQNCLIGVSSATCIYYNRDGLPGVGLTDDLVATVQGLDAQTLNLGDASVFTWQQTDILQPLLSDYIGFNRFHDAITGSHTYSAVASEAAGLRNSGWLDEGNAWSLLPAVGGEIGGLAEVHRLFNSLSNDHLLTLNDAEAAYAQRNGYVYEGVIGRALQPQSGVSELGNVQRYYKASTGEHIYTAISSEANALAALGFTSEGAVWAN